MKFTILTSILFDLLAKKKVTAKSIAEKYGVSERTAHRYINLLSESVPLQVKRGRSGGVCISDTYKLPADFMTETEYEAAIEALTLTYAENPQERFLTAKRKLSAQVKKQLREAPLRENAGSLLVDSGAWGDAPSCSEKIRLLQECIRERKILEIEYHSRIGEITHRKIEPHVLVFKKGLWHVYAFCRQKRDFRLFCVGRISSAVKTSEYYRKRPFDWKDALKESNSTNADLIEVRFELQPNALLDVQNKLGVENLRLINGKWYADVMLPDDDMLVQNVLAFGTGVQVLSPAHLREKLTKAIEKLKTLYS